MNTGGYTSDIEQPDNNNNFKKWIVLGVGALLAVLLVVWLISKFTGGIPQEQTDLSQVVRQQKQLVLIIDEYQNDVSNLDNQAYLAQVRVVAKSNTQQLEDYYQDNFSNTTIKTTVNNAVAEQLKNAADDGKLEPTLIDTVERLVSQTQSSINQLKLKITDRPTLEYKLDTAYRNLLIN